MEPAVFRKRHAVVDVANGRLRLAIRGVDLDLSADEAEDLAQQLIVATADLVDVDVESHAAHLAEGAFAECLEVCDKCERVALGENHDVDVNDDAQAWATMRASHVGGCPWVAMVQRNMDG